MILNINTCLFVDVVSPIRHQGGADNDHIYKKKHHMVFTALIVFKTDNIQNLAFNALK